MNLKWIVEKGVKFFQKTIVLSGDELLQSDFEDGIAMQEALARKAVGSFYTLEVVKGTSQAGKVYTNYELDLPVGQPDFSREKTVEEIDPEDLPF